MNSAYSRGRNAAAGLTACPECDLVQREPAGTAACTVRCSRCGAVLYRRVPHGLDVTLALTLAAAVLFAIANLFPVMSLELQGRRVATTLFGITQALEVAGMAGVGILVFLTLLLVPGLQILARLYLLLPLRFGRVPPRMALVARILASARAWSMVEVFALAAVVCIHRLNQIARLELEPAFWAIGGVMLLAAATDSVFDTRALWARTAGSLA
jgi:paraquat-inducible protein A